MTNDLTTLSGALLEMKDQLIYELGQKGVTASYDSSTGLLGLIGEISNIQQGGGSCYKVTFDNASYSTTGSVTVSVTVLKNYNACVGETVTFTSSTSTTTTATTDSNGVATATISFSGSTTLTASIGGATDTATITVASYIINDDASVDNSSTLFGEHISLRNSGTATATYNNNGYYVLTNTKSSAECFVEFPQLQGIYNESFKVTTRSQGTTSSVCPIALYYYLDSNNWGGVKDDVVYLWTSAKTNGVFSENSTATGNSKNVEVVSEFIFDVDENTLTVNDYVNSVLKGTKSMTVPVTLTSSVKWGTSTTWDRNTSRNLYEIKAEYL